MGDIAVFINQIKVSRLIKPRVNDAVGGADKTNLLIR